MAASAAARYEVRWRVTGTEQWSDIASISPVSEIVVEGLNRTKQYDFEVRAVSACGAKSDWGTGTNTIPGATTPPDIATITAQSLADGVHLAWTTADIPPAGTEYSVERSDDGTTGWAERARLRSTAYTDPETSGTTHYYRVAAVNFAGQFGNWSAVINNNGVNVSQIGSNASKALATQLPVINGGFDYTTPADPTYGWTNDTGVTWDFNTTSTGPGAGTNSAHHGPGGTSGAFRNIGLAGCNPGQVYKAQALIKAVGANGQCYVYISWCDASGAEIGTAVPAALNQYGQSNYITGTVSAQGSYAVGVAPNGTVYARTCLAATSHTAGDYYVDNVLCTQHPDNQDMVPDSSTYQRQTTNQGAAVVMRNPNFELGADAQGNIPGWASHGGGTIATQGTVVYSGSASLKVTNVGGGASGAESDRFSCDAGDVIAARCRAYASVGNPATLAVAFYAASGAQLGSLFTKSTSGYASWQTLALAASDNAVAPSGTSYFKALLYQTAATGYAYFDEVLITRTLNLSQHVRGALPNQTYVPARMVGNIPARVPSVISYSVPIGSVSPCTVTITLAAFTMLAGSYSVSYSALSTSISLARNTTTNVWLYFDDPHQAGGSPTLVATTNANDVYGADGRINVGGLSVVVPSSGTGSGGGGGGGGCVCVDQWLPGDVQAGSVCRGDLIYGTSGDLITQPYRVGAIRINRQPCWQLVTESGASVSASESTPMTLPGGALAMFPDMLHELVAVRRGDAPAAWERVTQLRYIGMRAVNQISIGGNCYWAGDEPGVYVSTHNTYVSPK